MKKLLSMLASLALAACGPGAPGSEPPPPAPVSCEDTPVVYLGGQNVGLSNRVQGLWTNPNVQTDAPDGANDVAENVELDRGGLGRPRVGQQRFASAYPDATQRFRAGTQYQGFSFEFASALPGGPGTLYRRNLTTGALAAVFNMSPPPGVMRPRFADADGDLYVTTSSGLRVLETPTSVPEVPGAPRAISFGANVSPFPTSVDWLKPDESVAYRHVFVREQPDGTRMYGVPSGIEVISNTTSTVTQGAVGSVILPTGVEAGDLLEIYRTESTVFPVDPGDTMFLAVQHEVTAADVTARFVAWTDNTPPALLGEPLYTNATQEGILGANNRPPLAADGLVFNGSLLLANTRDLQTFSLRLIGLPVIGSTITIAGETYLAKAEGDTASPFAGEFIVYSADPSSLVSRDIELTALSLNRAVNLKTTNTLIESSYVSTPTEPPGSLLFVARSVVTPVFSVQASAGGSNFEPLLSEPAFSAAETRPNGISVAKKFSSFAFTRYSDSRPLVGRDDRAILRIAALRNDVFVFKDGEGIFKMTPVGDGWNIEHMNQEVSLLIPESLAILDNRIIAYTTRGVVAVDAYGVEEVDIPVKDKFEKLANLPADVLQFHTFAASDPNRLCYWLWYPETSTSTAATRALLWNGRATPPAWTERTDAATGGYVGPDGLLYLGEAPNPGFTSSRTSGTVDDFQGPNEDAFTVKLSWPNRAEGMPGESKQYRQVRLFFEKPVGSKQAPLPVSWRFTNDYGNTSPVRTNQVYGLPYSSMEPDPGYQRTSDLGTEVSFPVLKQYVVVKGIEEVSRAAGGVRMQK